MSCWEDMEWSGWDFPLLVSPFNFFTLCLPDLLSTSLPPSPMLAKSPSFGLFTPLVLVETLGLALDCLSEISGASRVRSGCEVPFPLDALEGKEIGVGEV